MNCRAGGKLAGNINEASMKVMSGFIHNQHRDRLYNKIIEGV